MNTVNLFALFMFWLINVSVVVIIINTIGALIGEGFFRALRKFVANNIMI